MCGIKVAYHITSCSIVYQVIGKHAWVVVAGVHCIVVFDGIRVKIVGIVVLGGAVGRRAVG